MVFEENVQPNVAAVLLFPCWGSRFPTLVGVGEVEILNSKVRRIALPLQYPPPLGSRTLAHHFTYKGKWNWCVCECAHLSAFVCVSEFAALIKLPAFPLRFLRNDSVAELEVKRLAHAPSSESKERALSLKPRPHLPNKPVQVS